MQMTKEILKKWLDYRIKVHEDANKHIGLNWGKFDPIRGNYEFSVQECGIESDNKIQLYISQYAKKTKSQIFDAIINLLDDDCEYAFDGVRRSNGEVYDTDTDATFVYRGYDFFVCLDYDEKTIETREAGGLEV